MLELKTQLPEKLAPLFEGEARYRVAYGGRGSAKSWSVAQVLIERALESKIRILCCREFQNAIKDSAHKLLAETIDRLNVRHLFNVLDAEIRCKATGSDFIFKGLRRNAAEIKSTEGIDIAWVEEAEKTSKASWRVLTPTIRKPNSEIWLTYNPEDEEAHVHQLFVMDTPPTNSKIIKINWDDNPWFDSVLNQERLDCLARDPEEYEHVWNGNCRKALEGTYYGKILAEMRDQITEVPYDNKVPVKTYWDLGKKDATAIWFVQRVGFQWRIIDHEYANGEDLQAYAKIVNSKPYTYSAHVLPHDGAHDRLGMVGSIAYQLEDLITEGEVRVIPVTKDVEKDIQAAKLFLKQCWFDAEKCEDGLRCLRHYKRKWNEDRQRFDDKPLHDWASDSADAFRYFAIDNFEEEIYSREVPSLYNPFRRENNQQQDDEYAAISDYF